jgi:hypothetical protein
VSRSPRVERELAAVTTKYPGSRSVDEGGGTLLVVIPQYPIPPGFDRDAVRIAVRVSALYPAEKMDLFWLDPSMRRRDGGAMPNVMGVVTLDGESWTQISWHDNASHDPARVTILGYIHGIGSWFAQQVGEHH